MIELEKLVRATDVDVMEKSKQVMLDTLRTGKSGNARVYSCHARSPSTEAGTFYTTSIHLESKYVKISCSCQGFRFHYQEALKKVGGLSTEYLTPGVDRLPLNVGTGTKSRLGMCAHVYALVYALNNKGLL